MTKYQLEVEYDYDFILIGISCHVKDYRICWALNHALEIALEKQNDLEIIRKNKKGTSEHAVFFYYDEENHTEFNVVHNVGTAGYLIPEQKQADFYLIIRNDFDLEIVDLVNKVRQIDFVLTAFEVDIESLKSKQNLLL